MVLADDDRRGHALHGGFEQLAHVHLLNSRGSGLIARAQVEPDGRFALATVRTGIFRLEFTGVDHYSATIPLLAPTRAALVVHARLKHYAYADTLDNVAAIGDWNHFNFEVPKPLTRQPDGRYAVTVDATAVVWAPDWATTVLHGYTFTPNAPDPLAPVYAVASVKPPADVSTAGALIVTWTRSWGGMVYASLTGNAIPSAGVPYNALDPGRSGNPSTCKNNSFGEKFYSAAAFVVGGHAYVARALYVDADIVAVSDSCLSGLPTPTPSPVLPTATPTLPGPQPTATPTSPCPPCPCLTPTPRPTPTPQPTTPPAGLYCHFSNGTCKPIEELPGGMTCPGILNSVPCP